MKKSNPTIESLLEIIERLEARIRGFIGTVRKQGFNVLNSIQSVFSGNMLIPAGS